MAARGGMILGVKPIGASKKALLLACTFLAGAVGAWFMGAFSIQGGDWQQYLERPEFGFSRPVFHIREPGAVLLWQAFAHGYRRLGDGGLGHIEEQRVAAELGEHSRLARDAARRGIIATAQVKSLSAGQRIVGFWIFDAICGGIYLFAVIGFMLNIRADVGWRHAVALLVVLGSAASWVFFKHFEFYAPLYAALAFVAWMGIRYFCAPSFARFAALIAALFIAINMHRVAIFYLPALALVFRDPSATRGFRRPTRNEIALIAAATFGAALLHTVPVYLATIDVWKALVLEDYNRLSELLTPFTQSWADYASENSRLGAVHRFTFGTVEHWKHFFFFVLIGSPLALPAIAAMAKKINSPGEKFLVAMAACGWLWALFWHPHLSYADWNLFCNPAVPGNLLAAVLILKSAPTVEDRIPAR